MNFDSSLQLSKNISYSCLSLLSSGLVGGELLTMKTMTKFSGSLETSIRFPGAATNRLDWLQRAQGNIRHVSRSGQQQGR